MGEMGLSQQISCSSSHIELSI